jgi:hypothetical protein
MVPQKRDYQFATNPHEFPHTMLRTSPKGMPETPWAQGGPRSDTRDLWHRW